MTDSQDIVERLMDNRAWSDVRYQTKEDRICTEAADEITRLRAELAALRAHAQSVSDAMLVAALETEFEGTSLRNLVNAQLWHHGAYGNAKAVVRSALENALVAAALRARAEIANG